MKRPSLSHEFSIVTQRWIHASELKVTLPLLTDSEIRQDHRRFSFAARVADELGYDFVDIKHCHGYLGHEFLSAHTREGEFGGSFENRTRFLREIVAGIRAIAPRLQVGVRLSAFDLVSFRPDPDATVKRQNGTWDTGLL